MKRSVEVKKIDKKKVALLLRKMNLFLNNRRIKNFPEKEIQKQVFFDVIIHTKGNPIVIINPYTDQSYWNWKKNYINVGILTALSTKADPYSPKQIAKSLFYHELSHENHTSVPKDIPYPFSLLNILEDERIERLAIERFEITEEDFSKLHSFSFTIYYHLTVWSEVPEFQEMVKRIFNPYNLIIVHRWMRWNDNVKELYEKVLNEAKKLNSIPAQIEKVLPEYTQDIEKVLDDATNSKSTEELIENTKWFYEKWKYLFTPETEANIQMGAGHGQGKEAGDIGEGYGQSEESKDGDDQNTDGQGIGKNSEEWNSCTN